MIDPREVDWENVHERMQGYQVGDPVGKKLADIVTQMGSTVVDFILAQGDTVTTQVLGEMRKARVPGKYAPYVFFTLMEGEEFWPSMTPSQKESLKLALRIEDTADKIPSYSRSLQLPEK